ARRLAALVVAAPMIVLLTDSAAAQATAAQKNAVRQYCRADFAEKCPGVIEREALICLEANLDSLSRNCKKAVLVALGEDPNAEPVVDAAPATPAPRAASRNAPIVSTQPPEVGPPAQRVRGRGAPAPVDDQASTEIQQPPEDAPPRRASARSEPLPPPNYAPPRRGREAAEAPPPDYATKRRAAAEHQSAAGVTEADRPDGLPAESLPVEGEQVEALPSDDPAPRNVSPARRAKAATRHADPLVEACWNELNHNCAGVRPGGGR